MYLILICLLAFSNFIYFHHRIKLYNINNYSINKKEYNGLLLFSNLLFIILIWRSKSFYMSSFLLGFITIECCLIAYIDLKYYEITHSSISLLSVFSICYLIALNQFSFSHLLSGLILFSIFFIFYLFFNVGGGDVKLAFSIGLFFKPYYLLDYLIIVFSLSLVICLLCIIYCKKQKTDIKEFFIPFAPFMIITLLCYL